jgi:beta-lactamase class C
MLKEDYSRLLKTEHSTSFEFVSPMSIRLFLRRSLQIASFGIAAGFAGISQASNHLPQFVGDFERFIAEQVAPDVPGAAIAVVADGKVQLIRTYGVRQQGQMDPVTEDTVFRLASVSKTFAGTAAALAVQQQQLSWDTPLKETLKHVQLHDPRYAGQITLRDLLSHTTGLIPQAYTNLIEHNVPYERVVGRLKEVQFSCQPRKCHGYQNVVFSLAGDMIQARTGKPYEDFVSENLFRPLGMYSASFGMDGLKSSNNYAMPHVHRRGQWRVTNIRQNYYNLPPAAGVNASINDMAKWLLAHLGQRPDVLPTQSLDQLQAKLVPTRVARSHYGQRPDQVKTWYGLGWRVFDTNRQQNFVHHGGWVEGFRAEMLLNRELGIGMVFLTNAETRLAKDVTFAFVNAYNDELDRQQSLPVQLITQHNKSKSEKPSNPL